jgi:adenylate cyclase
MPFMKTQGHMEEQPNALFIEAERSAERIAGQLRMATAIGLSGVFALAVVTHAHREDAVLAVH